MVAKKPLVSVIIPVYNGAAVVVDAVRSMLQQSFQNLEILVVDDGSQDGTVQILRQTFNDDRLHLIEHGTNLGAALARNTGLGKAAGSIIAFLDADDISMPHRIEAQLHYLDQHKDVGAVGSAVELFGDKEEEGVIAPLCAPDDIAASTMFTCEFLMPSMTFRREAFDTLDELFKPEYGSNCDWEIYARLVRNVRVANTPDRLVKYRRWPQQMTSRIVDTLDCPATLLRSEMLEWFGCPVEEQDLSAHIVSSPCYWPMEISLDAEVDRRRVMRWLKKIRRTNEVHKRFWPDSLDRVLLRCLHSHIATGLNYAAIEAGPTVYAGDDAISQSGIMRA